MLHVPFSQHRRLEPCLHRQASRDGENASLLSRSHEPRTWGNQTLQASTRGTENREGPEAGSPGSNSHRAPLVPSHCDNELTTEELHNALHALTLVMRSPAAPKPRRRLHGRQYSRVASTERRSGGLSPTERRQAVAQCCTKLDLLEQGDTSSNARKHILLRNQVRMLLELDWCAPSSCQSQIDAYVRCHRLEEAAVPVEAEGSADRTCPVLQPGAPAVPLLRDARVADDSPSCGGVLWV